MGSAQSSAPSAPIDLRSLPDSQQKTSPTVPLVGGEQQGAFLVRDDLRGVTPALLLSCQWQQQRLGCCAAGVLRKVLDTSFRLHPCTHHHLPACLPAFRICTRAWQRQQPTHPACPLSAATASAAGRAAAQAGTAAAAAAGWVGTLGCLLRSSAHRWAGCPPCARRSHSPCCMPSCPQHRRPWVAAAEALSQQGILL